jgi:hypothetical protein
MFKKGDLVIGKKHSKFSGKVGIITHTHPAYQQCCKVYFDGIGVQTCLFVWVQRI